MSCDDTYAPRVGPVRPGNRYRYVQFNGLTSYIDCGSDASIDDIWFGSITLDFWARSDHALAIDQYMVFANKNKWSVQLINDTGVDYLEVEISVCAGEARSRVVVIPATYTVWHHYTVFYTFGVVPRLAYLAIDGTWVTAYATQIASICGAIQSDSGSRLTIGATTAHADNLDGGIQWLRISSIERWVHGVDFAPPNRCAPPVVDANTLELWAMDEGTGATTAAEVNATTNDGAMTNCTWRVCH